jgi:hypothetical protein
LVDFIQHLKDDEEMLAVGEEVKAFASTFSIPGV